jgi:UDPglucose--hexose-1-phosphate uridylyltransferase
MVIVAPERAARPNSPFDDAPPERCPFCPGHEADTPPELERVAGDDGAWRIRVVPNRYPAVTVNSAGAPGTHELIVDTPTHESTPYEFDDDQVELLLRLYQRRLGAALENGSIEYAVAFKNSGPAAGETLSHPHSQLIALASAPRSDDRCEICHELRDPAIVDREGSMLAVAPRGARLPYELFVTAREHGSSFSREERPDELARLVRRVLGRIRQRFNAPSFNWYVEEFAADRHYALVIIPRLTNVAGFELASGMWINVVEPERVVRELGSVRSQSE